jgi:hypothetical protein
MGYEESKISFQYESRSLSSYLHPESEIEELYLDGSDTLDSKTAKAKDHMPVIEKAKKKISRTGREVSSANIKNVLEKAKSGKQKTSKGRIRKKANG